MGRGGGWGRGTYGGSPSLRGEHHFRTALRALSPVTTPSLSLSSSENTDLALITSFSVSKHTSSACSDRKRTPLSGQMSSPSTATERGQYSVVKCPARSQRQKEDNIQWSNVQLVHSNYSVVPLGWGKVFQIGIGLSVCPLSSSSTATERGQHSTSMVKINVQLVQTNRERTTRSGQMSSSSTATERGQHSTLNGQD